MTLIVAVNEIHYVDADTGKQVIAKPGTLFSFDAAESLGDAVREPTEGELAIHENGQRLRSEKTAKVEKEKPVKGEKAPKAEAPAPAPVADPAPTVTTADELVG